MPSRPLALPSLLKTWTELLERPLVRRLQWWALWGLLGTVLLLIAGGKFRELGAGTAGLGTILASLLLLGLLLVRMWPGRSEQHDEVAPEKHLTTGAAQLTLGFALAQGLGGLWGEAAVVRYALVAVVLGFHRGLRLVGLIVLSLCCEGLFRYATGQHQLREILGSLLILGLFMGLREAVFRGELLRQQLAHKQRVKAAILDIERQAELFRLNLTEDALLAQATDWTDHGSVKTVTAIDHSEPENRQLHSAVVMVRQNLDALVGLLRRAMGLSTCAVLWQSEDGSTLEVVAASTDSPLQLRRSVPASAGLLGSVRKTRALLSVTAPKPSQLSYYDRPDSLGDTAHLRCTATMLLPLFEEGALCGVLCVDRFESASDKPTPFSSRDEEALRAAVPVILRSVQSERVFRSVERVRDASLSLAVASGLLSAALRPEEVVQSALQATLRLCPFDFAALTEYDDKLGQHSVLSASGDPTLCLQVKALRFPDNEGLCSSVIRRQIILPAFGILRDHGEDTQVFDDTTRLRGYQWLMVVPLLLHKRPRGTLIVAGRSEKSMPERQAQLKVLANQIAVSLDNARMYQAVESLATTDGLTGLYNRRTFQQRIDEMRERAHRQGRTLSLIMCDIDHFKKINDTRGHLVGDEVLRQIARLLAETVRKVDVAARYGGEEFAILLEATEEEGAQLLAERIRHEAEKLQLSSEKGAFSCTLSLGLATFPGDGRTTIELIAHADAALYAAKHRGRNRVVSYRELAASKERPAA